MTQLYVFGIIMLVACTLLEVSSYPSAQGSTTPVEDLTEASEEKGERSLSYDETNIENEDATKEILKKIAAINEALKKPHKRHQFPWNPPQPSDEYVLDKDILEKLQQVIASGKLHSYSNNLKQQDSNTIINENADDNRYSRQISPVFAGNPLAGVSTAYMTNIPVLVVPSSNGNPMDLISSYQTRQGESPSPSPFQPFQPFQGIGQLQWPLAPLFPILIRDPLLSIMNGGGFQNFIEYGQSADVCKRKQKSEPNDNEKNENLEKAVNSLLSSNRNNYRQKRAVKKRSPGNNLQDNETNKVKKLFSLKPTTAKPAKLTQEPTKNTKTADESEGDLRFPFLFGHKEKPSGPGFFINRLKVRRGGVAIAGPGGVATAGRGGTAIVGPGGLAYTQPGGLAVAGPAARVIALSSESDLTSIANRLRQQSTIDGSVRELIHAIPEGRHVATGPIIYFHPNTRYISSEPLPYYGGAKGQYLVVEKDITGKITSEKIVPEENLSSENIIKNRDGNLITKVMVANLQKLNTLSTSLLKLTNVGRKAGHLEDSEKATFKNELTALGKAASNMIKLIDEIDDVDMLFKRNMRKYNDEEDNDYVIVEEGVGIEASSDDGTAEGVFDHHGTIAEAKPVGLAVIGENGLAASRPVATAVAASGVAIARPIATAIAGVDPAALGIDFQVNHAYSKN